MRRRGRVHEKTTIGAINISFGPGQVGDIYIVSLAGAIDVYVKTISAIGALESHVRAKKRWGHRACRDYKGFNDEGAKYKRENEGHENRFNGFLDIGAGIGRFVRIGFI